MNTNRDDTRDADTIVVGVDGSAGSIAALRWAIGEAVTTRGMVRAVMSWRPEPLVAPPAPPVAPLEVLRREQHQLLQDAVTEARGTRHDVDIETELVEGLTAEQLVKASQHARMLVVGSHGYGRIRGVLLGSISAACVHQAVCPVVVIPHGMVTSHPNVPAGQTPAQS